MIVISISAVKMARVFLNCEYEAEFTKYKL